MSILFLVVAIAGGGYFLFRKRQFDFLAVAYFSSCFYFIPGFVGFAGYPSAGAFDPVPIHPQTYVVLVLVLSLLLATAIVTDIFAKPSTATRAGGEYWRFLTPMMTSLAIFGCMLSMITIGSELFSTDKVSLLSKLNRWFLLWTTSATLGLVLAASRRQYILAATNLCLLLFVLYIGFRVEITVALLAVATMRMAEQGPQRLFRHWKLGIAVVTLGIGLFVYKYLLFALKLNDWNLMAEQMRNPDAFRLIFFHSEPFIILGILNETIRQDLQVGLSHLDGCLYLLLPFANELGAQFIGFDKLYQPKLFSSVTTYGIGSNIWAEMIASGSWPLLLAFSVGYTQLLAFGRIVAARMSLEWTAIISVILVYAAFYIHRNDLLFQLTLMRRVFLTALVCALASAVWVLALKHPRRAVAEESASLYRSDG